MSGVGIQITCGAKDLERKDLGGLGKSGMHTTLPILIHEYIMFN
jgi:hypothetical protein